MDKKIFAKDEFIGLSVKVTQSNDPNWIGKTGIILNETKNMFLIKINKKDKKIEKKNSQFEFKYDGKKIIIDGSQIAYRPEERIKKTR